MTPALPFRSQATSATLVLVVLCCTAMPVAPRPPTGLYVGYSGGHGCRSGWLLRIGPGGRSALYVSPYLIRGRVAGGPSGQATLLNAESPDGSRYTVTEGAGGVAASVVITVRYERGRARRFRVAFRRATGPGSIYSDVRRLRGTGDLVGTELALTRAGRQLVGVLTRFQGEAGRHLAVSGPADGRRPVLSARGCRAARIVVTPGLARIGGAELPLRGALSHFMATGRFERR